MERRHFGAATSGSKLAAASGRDEESSTTLATKLLSGGARKVKQTLDLGRRCGRANPSRQESRRAKRKQVKDPSDRAVELPGIGDRARDRLSIAKIYFPVAQQDGVGAPATKRRRERGGDSAFVVGDEDRPRRAGP